MKTSPPERILIIKPSSLGDIIHSLPFLKAIRDSFPEACIEWVVSKKLKGILEGHPLINNLIIFNKDEWGQFKDISKTVGEMFAVIKELRAKSFDLVIDLQGLLRSGIISFFASAPVKIGFEEAREGSRLFYNKRISVNGSLHAVDKYLEIAKAILKEHRIQNTEKVEFPLYIDRTAKESVKKLLSETSTYSGGRLKEKEYVVIVPSARWQTKRWPAEYFGALIAGLPIPSVITGGNADKEIAQKVVDSSKGNGIDLSGRTNLKELIALIAGAKAVVSNDSGPMHIAAALNIPVVALFGPTDPEKTGPYGWNRPGAYGLTVLRSSLNCSPCFKKTCKEPICMSAIPVKTVFEELRKYL
ncbi:MAG: lipopolysaccharide heptosyltransferase I [Nitrospirae bacterium]|nr:lipopolysaccharide heptosyltransferase I [Nitrospirota bacterium]